MNRSIRLTLRLGLAAGLLATFLLLWFLVGQTIRLLSEEYVTDRLEQEIESLLTELSLDRQDQIRIDEREIDAIFHHAFSGHYFQVVVSEKGVQKQFFRSRSLGDSTLSIPPLQVGVADHFFLEGPQGQPLMVLAKAMPIREYTLTIAVGEDRTPFLDNFQKFQWDFTLIALGAFLLLFLLQGMLLRLAFRPFQRLRDEVRLLDAGQVSRLRLDAPDEVAPLVHSVNRLLAVTDHQVERSRNALGNLSHAMKLPITALTQLASRGELAPHPGLRQQLHDHANTLASLVDRQLKRARLLDPARPGSLFCLARELPPLVRTLKSIYYQRHLEIDLAVQETDACRGDREDLMELVGNLADNGCKWAASRVRIASGREEGFFWIAVEDDGPGCEEEEMDRLRKRGTRLDETRDGHGLGLAIVADVVEMYGGRLILGRSEALGGFLARVELPEP